MKKLMNMISCLLIPLLLLGLLAVGTTPAHASPEWTMELRNNVGASASLNKVWCASPLGDLSFGPVLGADTSAPDGSTWAVTQPSDQFLVQLHLPSLDYSCRLEVQGFSPPLWTFSLPLMAMAADDDVSPAGDIKCSMPADYSGIGSVPPSCELFNADGYATAFVSMSPLDDAEPPAAAPSTTAADVGPAPAPVVLTSSSDISAPAPAGMSPASVPSDSSSSSDDHDESASSMSSAPAPSPRPALGRRLLLSSAQ